MTDYEPWAGTNFHVALHAEKLEEQRNNLNWLVYRGKKCIAAFASETTARRYVKGKQGLKVQQIPFYVPFHD